MLCENCGKHGAEIHLVKIVNGVRIDEDICRECAEKMMPFNDAAKALKMSFSLEGMIKAGDALRNFLFPILPELYESEGKEMKCPHCGKEIDADGLFGGLESAGDDKEVVFDFSQAAGDSRAAKAADVPPPAAQRPGAEAIKREDRPCSAEKELAGLKKELEFVLRGERYERAAEIRDRIIELEKAISEKTEGA